MEEDKIREKILVLIINSRGYTGSTKGSVKMEANNKL
jgi:hypothetical protein